MMQMKDSASATTRDGFDTQTYSISSDDMFRLKSEIASLEAEVRASDASAGRPYPSTALQTASDIRTSLDKIKPTSVLL